MRFLSIVSVLTAALSGGAVGDGSQPACGSGACDAGDEDEVVSQLQLSPRLEKAQDNCDHFAPAELFGESDPFDLDSLFRNSIGFHRGQPTHAVAPLREHCNYTAGECPKAAFRDEYVNVYPGGQTKCLDGSDFYFTVRRGNPKKLHIHFQGGGACWDFLSYNLNMHGEHLCYQQVQEMMHEGILNKSNDENPWQDYSFVIINYCSGDMHGGHSDHRWKLDLGKAYVRGVDNSKAAIQWALRNFQELDQFTVSGSSAGSLGIQLWSRRVLDQFHERSKDLTVVGDSFVGVLYPPSQQQSGESTLYRIWDLCQHEFFTNAEVQQCKTGHLLLANVWTDAMRKYRNARFVAMNSKMDKIQFLFEKAFEATQLNLRGALMTKGQFYKYASLQLKEWYKEENFHTYLVDGDQHTFLPQYMDIATPESPDGDAVKPAMINWLHRIVHIDSNEPSALKTVCFGPSFPINNYTVARNDTDYCAKALAGVASSAQAAMW